jgi:predicted secreted hydrolase
MTETPGVNGVQLPQDEAPHQDPVEWWYFNGHLQGVDASGHEHRYGFEYVTFQYLGLAPAPVYFGNFAITDLTRGMFQYGVEEDSYPVPTTVDSFSLRTGDWTMSGGSGHDQLHADIPGYTLDLRLQATEPPVLHGDDGIVSMGPIGTSYYYSWTSLSARGTIVDHGLPVRVVGMSWMDHQWGALDLTSGAGWDWFSIQLSDHQQYMLFFIRSATGQIVETFGTRVGPGGRVQHLDSGAIAEQATGSWQSPVTGITYGSGWQVSVPGGQLDVTPDLTDQELDLLSSQGVAYWEGDVSVQGEVYGQRVDGVGYTELNPPATP